MDLVSRLKQYLDSRQISVTQFADECSIPRPTGSQLLAGRNKKVSDEIISKIHLAYPDLSIVWLMFGEGEMTTDANIKFSEPQKQEETGFADSHTTDSQPHIKHESYMEQEYQNHAEKTQEIDESSFEGNTFSFSSNPPASPAETNAPDTTLADVAEKAPITITPGNGKRVTGIVVYYDDSTYESFIPDPTHRHPFMI
ncbi:MAG: helix-turn-helix domain-containing protein [Duncaniella sp.]|nr:helix-turn-helix domain-containing protein [Duncaniella sp.]